MEAAKSVTSTEVASNASETVALRGKIVTSRRKGRLFFVVTRTQNYIFLAGEPGEVSPFFSEESCVVCSVPFFFEGFETIFLVYSGKTATIFLTLRKKKSAFVSCERWTSFGRITLVLQEWYLGCRRI